MFFLIRCVFWLTVVFSSMSWAVGSSRPQGAPGRALVDAVITDGAAAAGAVTHAAVGQAKAWCVKRPDQCLQDAVRLTALVKAHSGEDMNEAPDVAEQTGMLIPVPHPDPRHHAVPKG